MIQNFADLRRDELDALPRELTVFLFPTGGLEQHGPHLPIGTKFFQAETATRQLAEILNAKMPQWNFLLMPAVPMTVDTLTSTVALPVRAHVMRDFLVDQCRGLKRLGFSKFAVYSAHLTPRQLSTVEEACKMVSKRRALFFGQKATMVSVTSQEVTSGDVMRSPMIGNPKEHGGAVDTAYILLTRQNRVGKNYSELAEVPRTRESVGRLIAYFGGKIDGYWGNPVGANPDQLKKDQNESLEKIAVMLQSVFESGQGTGLFNSGYRYFFFNGSFFIAYLFGAIFFAMMMVWTLWSLRDVFEP